MVLAKVAANTTMGRQATSQRARHDNMDSLMEARVPILIITTMAKVGIAEAKTAETRIKATIKIATSTTSNSSSTIHRL